MKERSHVQQRLRELAISPAFQDYQAGVSFEVLATRMQIPVGLLRKRFWHHACQFGVELKAAQRTELKPVGKGRPAKSKEPVGPRKITPGTTSLSDPKRA